MNDDAILTGIFISFVIGLTAIVGHGLTRTHWGTKFCHERFAHALTATDTLAVVQADVYCYRVLTRKP